MKKVDVIATPAYKRSLEEYGLGFLKNKNGGDVNGPQEAKQIASFKTNQSYNEQIKNRKNHDRYGISR